MAVSGGEVNVTLGMDSSSFNRGLQAADQQFARSNKAMIDGLKQQGQSFSKMNKAATTAGAAIGALSIAVVNFSRSSFRVAADVSEMNVAIDAIGKSSGAGATQIHTAAKEIRSMGIEMKAAQEMALLFVQGNLDLSKASKIARVAQDLAVVSQSNSTQTAKTLAYAIQTGNSRLLKSAGITKYASEAYEEFALSLGKSTTELTNTERQTAVMNMIIEEGAKVAGTYEAAMTEAGKVLRSFPRIINDIQLAFGQVFMKDLGEVIKKVYDATKAFSLLIREGGVLRPIIEELGEAFSNMIRPIGVFFDKVTTNLKNMQYMEMSFDGLSEKVEKFAPVVAAAATAMSAFAGTQLLARLSSMVPLMGGLGTMIGPAGPVVAGVAALAILSPELRQALSGVLDALKPLIPVFTDMAMMAAGMLAKLTEIAAKLLEAFTPLLEIMIYNIAKAIESLVPMLEAAAKFAGKFSDAMNGIDLGKVGQALSLIPGIGFLFQGVDDMNLEKANAAVNNWADNTLAQIKRTITEADPAKLIEQLADKDVDLLKGITDYTVLEENTEAAGVAVERLVDIMLKLGQTSHQSAAEVVALIDSYKDDDGVMSLAEAQEAYQRVLHSTIELERQLAEEHLANNAKIREEVEKLARRWESTYVRAAEDTALVTEKFRDLAPEVDAAGVSVEQYIDAMLGSTSAQFQNTVAMDNLRKSTQGYLDGVAEMKKEEMDLIEVQKGLFDAFVNLGTGMKNANKSAYETQFAQAELIQSFYATMEASDHTREEIDKLIHELGILDGMDPVINVLLDVDANVRNTEAMMAALEAALFFDPSNKEAREMLDNLKKVAGGYAKAAATGGGTFGITAGTYTPSSAGTGGSATTPYDTTGALTGLGGMFGPDMAASLLGASPSEIGASIDAILSAGLDVAGNLSGSALTNLKRILANLGKGSFDLQAMAESAENFAYQLVTAEDDLAFAEDNLANAIARKNKILEDSVGLQNESIRAAKDQVFQSDLLKTTQSGVVFSAEEVLGNYTTFRNNLLEMKKRGFPPSLIAQVYQAGPNAGIAGNILSMDAGGLKNYVDTMAQIEAIAGEVGALGADALYGGALAGAETDVSLAQADVLTAKENVAAMSSSLDALTVAMQELISELQLGFLGSLQGLQGGAAGKDQIGQLITQANTGLSVPNQSLGTAPNNITINMPAGSDGDDVVRALQEYMRKNGSVPILTVEP
jgi:hypothetical protein